MTSWCISLMLLAASAALWRLRRAVADTTLDATWWWTLASVASVCVVELLVAWTATNQGAAVAPKWIVAARFAASVTTFCPVMAVFGAKRPQDRAWSLIVFSLWIVLVLPAGELLLLSRGANLEVQGLRAWFLVLLLVMGWLNVAMTRMWLAGTVAALAQIGLLAEHWPLFGRTVSTDLRIGAIACGAAALVVASGWRPASPDRRPFDRVWLDFRDLFGLMWALRVAERVNAASQQNGWHVTLGWNGFRGAPFEQLPAAQRAAFEQTFWNLCQRFVSREWFERRCGTRGTESTAQNNLVN